MNHNTRPLQHWERQGLIWNAQLSPTQKFVLFAYESFASADSHECFPSYGTIAEKTGYQKRTVIDAVGELVSLGILSKESRFRPNGSQTSNNYRIIYRALMGMIQMHPPHAV
jgi:GntR family transcriptional regulator